MYIVLAPLFFFVTSRRIKYLSDSVKTGDKSRIKAESFFLMLTLSVAASLVLLIEWWSCLA